MNGDAIVSSDVRRTLELFAAGLYTGEVAERLGLDPDVVRRHLAEAMVAVGARSKLVTVIRAFRLGLIEPAPVERP